MAKQNKNPSSGMKRSEKHRTLQEDAPPAVTGFATSPRKSREKLVKGGGGAHTTNQLSEESMSLDDLQGTKNTGPPHRAPPKRRRSTDQVIPEDEQVEIFDESSSSSYSNSSERESLPESDEYDVPLNDAPTSRRAGLARDPSDKSFNLEQLMGQEHESPSPQQRTRPARTKSNNSSSSSLPRVFHMFGGGRSRSSNQSQGSADYYDSGNDNDDDAHGSEDEDEYYTHSRSGAPARTTSFQRFLARMQGSTERFEQQQQQQPTNGRSTNDVEFYSSDDNYSRGGGGGGYSTGSGSVTSIPRLAPGRTYSGDSARSGGGRRRGQRRNNTNSSNELEQMAQAATANSGGGRRGPLRRNYSSGAESAGVYSSSSDGMQGMGNMVAPPQSPPHRAKSRDFIRLHAEHDPAANMQSSTDDLFKSMGMSSSDMLAGLGLSYSSFGSVNVDDVFGPDSGDEKDQKKKKDEEEDVTPAVEETKEGDEGEEEEGKEKPVPVEEDPSLSTPVPQAREPDLKDEPEGRLASVKIAKEAADRLVPLYGYDDVRDHVDLWKTERYCHRVFRHRATHPDTKDKPCFELWETPEKSEINLTYFEMHQVAETVAAWISAACGDKSPKDQIICVYLPRSLGMMCSVIGGFYCGCGVAVVDTKLPWSRLEYIVGDANAALVITDETLAGKADGFPCPILNIAAAVEKKKPAKCWFSDLGHSDNIKAKPGHLYDTELGDDDACVVIYTSGSTGNPKGVSLQYKAFSNYACIEQVLTKPTPEDRVVQTQSLSFIAGFHECWRALCGGAVLVMANAKVTQLGPDLEQWLVDREITIMKAVPSLLRSMLIGDRRPELPKMRLFHVGGEAVTQDIVDLFGPGRLFLNTYGSTETCSNCVIGFCAPGDQHCTIGRPLPSFQGVILHDPKADFEVNKGQLYIKSISLAKGYLNLDEKTKEVFIEHPKYGRIYATGDIVERLPEYGNCIVYRGRSDNQLKINGYRVELGEVEAKLNMISIVKEAAAVAVDNTIYAFVTLADGKTLTVGEMQKQVKEFGLPFFAVPARLEIVDKFPKTISGKLDRKVLKKQIEDANKAAAEASNAYDQSDALGMILGTFAEILKCKVEEDDDFFTLGGGSATAGQAVGLIRYKGEKINLPTVSILDLYTHRTAKNLYAHIQKQSESGAGTVDDVWKAKRMEIEDRPNKCLFDFVTLLVGLTLSCIDAFEIAIYFMIYWQSEYVIPVATPRDVEIPDPLGVFRITWKMMVVKLSFYFVWTFLAIIVKWSVIGRYRPGRWAKFGPYHLRHWVVTRFVSHLPWRLIGGTGISNPIMKALGAKVGKNVFTAWEPATGSAMSGFDLYTLEDYASICQGCFCSPIYFDDESMVAGRIHLERFATLYPRATASGNVLLKEGSVLDSLSMVGDGSVLGAWEFWSGSMAKHVGDVEDPPVLPKAAPGPFFMTLFQIFDVLFGYYIVMLFSMIPRFGLLTYLHYRGIDRVQPHLFVGSVILSIFFGSFALTMFAIMLVKLANLIAPSKGGSYVMDSWYTLLLWHKLFWFKSPQLMLNNTRFLQWFARACGMKLALGSSISNVRGCIPDLVEIGDTSFLANPCFVGVPIVQHGMFSVGPVKIGEFVLGGNNSFYPINCVVPDNTTVAVNTSCPPPGAPTGGIWVGHPAVRIADNVATPHPHGKLRDEIFFFASEVLIVFVPAVFMALTILTWIYLWIYFVFGSGLVPDDDRLIAFSGGVLLVPLKLFWGLVSGFFAKVTLSGFTKVPIEKNVDFWNPLCYRWRVYHKVWAFFLIPVMLKDFSGSKWMNRLLNLVTMAEIEDDVLIVHHGVFRDHDYVRIRRGATVNEACIFRTHTFEDWRLKFGFVEIGPKSVVLPSTTVMFGVQTKKRCLILPNALVLKGDTLADDTIVGGIPAAPKKNVLPSGVESHLEEESDDEEPVKTRSHLDRYLDRFEAKTPNRSVKLRVWVDPTKKKITLDSKTKYQIPMPVIKEERPETDGLLKNSRRGDKSDGSGFFRRSQKKKKPKRRSKLDAMESGELDGSTEEDQTNASSPQSSLDDQVSSLEEEDRSQYSFGSESESSDLSDDDFEDEQDFEAIWTGDARGKEDDIESMGEKPLRKKNNRRGRARDEEMGMVV